MVQLVCVCMWGGAKGSWALHATRRNVGYTGALAVTGARRRQIRVCSLFVLVLALECTCVYLFCSSVPFLLKITFFSCVLSRARLCSAAITSVLFSSVNTPLLEVYILLLYSPLLHVQPLLVLKNLQFNVLGCCHQLYGPTLRCTSVYTVYTRSCLYHLCSRDSADQLCSSSQVVPLSNGRSAILQFSNQVAHSSSYAGQSLMIQPRDRPTLSISVKPWVLSSITTDMPARQLPAQVRVKCSHLNLADLSFDKPAPVDMLIGADIFPQVWNKKSSSLGPGFPLVYSSVFGWVLIGSVQEHPDIGVQSMLVSLVSSMEDLMKRFWSVEEPEAAPQQFTENGLCEEMFHSEVSRDSHGWFSVPLPFRSGQPVKSFPGSRQVTLNRFLHLERKLAADNILYAAYRKFMSEYEELGHMTRAEDTGQYYIPHHAVQKVDGDDVKLRVVFDASVKCHLGVSLNQCLLVGLKLQQDIVDVLVGFRVHKVAFTTDIFKMYRQIEILPQYRRCQYILWRESPQVVVKEYTLNTVTYGVNSTPYLALRVLCYIEDTEYADQPDLKRALYNQMYMDDICVGAESLEAAKVMQSNLIQNLVRSSLQLRK
ncbi:hypothetical protein QTP88_008517 [Uroleucon formosanum]